MAKTSIPALEGGIGCCQTAIHELNAASSDLANAYRNAGQDWHDNKYAELGEIVGKCYSSLKKPIEDLEKRMENLKKILEYVREYEAS